MNLQKKKDIQHFEKKKIIKHLKVYFLISTFIFNRKKYSNLVQSYFLILMLFGDFKKFYFFLNILNFEDFDDQTIKFCFGFGNFKN